jgi:phage-related protein
MGSSRKDLMTFPEAVQLHLGSALGVAQFGGEHPDAKPWKGDGPGVMEIVEDHRGDTFRAVYAVRFEGAVYAVARFPEEVEERCEDAKDRSGFDCEAAAKCTAGL